MKLSSVSTDIHGFTAPSPFSSDEHSFSADTDTKNDSDTASSDGSVTINKNGHFIHCLTIIGQIEGHYILPSGTKATK